jgi:hypothetical protein
MALEREVAMRVPNIDWAPNLFADEPAARRGDAGPPAADASQDDAGCMWPAMAQAWTAGAARQPLDGHQLAEAA